MNDDYLDAECVIDGLVTARFIEKEEWKHTGRERFYPALFWRVEGKSLISFEVRVIDQKHKIQKSRLRFLANKYHEDFSGLFKQCAV